MHVRTHHVAIIISLGVLSAGLAAADPGKRQPIGIAKEDFRLRSARSSRAGVVRVVMQDEEVEILGARGSWVLLRSDRRLGWVPRATLLARVERKRAPGVEEAPARSTPAPPPAKAATEVPPAQPSLARTATRSRSRGAIGALEGRPVPPPVLASAPAPQRDKLKGLRPAFRKKVERVLARLRPKWPKVRVAEGYRTEAQQREKVRKGYSKTMNSKHRKGLAADIVCRHGWHGPAAKLKYRFWKDLGRAAKAEGLRWGGDWKSFKDVAHVYQ